MKSFVAALVAGSFLGAACGASGHPYGVQPVSPTSNLSVSGGVFVECSAGAAGGTSTYAIVNAPSAGCRELVAGRDYADGRVIIGLKPAATEAELGQALAAFHAIVISSQPALGDRLLGVPNGSVPQAVVGLATYSFIAFAAPDKLNQVDPSKS